MRHRGEFASDIRSHSRGVGFFTVAVAVAVFGTEPEMQWGAVRLAAAV